MERMEVALANLRTETKRLTHDQGRVARRNARRAVLGALKQVRNALSDFPQIVAPPKDGDAKKFVVDVWEPAHREGRHLYADRWRVLRIKDFDSGRVLSTFRSCSYVSFNGFTLGPVTVKQAMTLAKWLGRRMPDKTFRARLIGTEDAIIANLL